jgi:hypothetical protein
MPQQARRTALQIAAQLPSEPDEALKVLEYAKEIVEKFFVGQPVRASGSIGGSRPKLRAISGDDTLPK